MIDKTQKAHIKTRIQEDIIKLNSEIILLQKELEPIEPQCALGDLGRFELMHEQEVMQKALHLAQNRLQKLTHVMTIIDKDDFGACIECG